jgi:chemotaxis protein methyltransferase CheR
MKISDFELYRDLLLRHCGLSLTQEKTYMLISRLTPVARKHGYPTLEAMTLALRGVPDMSLVNEIVETLVETDTSFFRDTHVFHVIRDTVIPHLVKARARKKDLRIWCAGCSTGQEAYSIAILLKDMEAHLRGWSVDIFGTDISENTLRRARTGQFSQFEVQRGLPVQSLIKWFDEIEDGWRLHPDVAGLVTFEHFNLLEPMDDLGAFDLILCRYVLEQFDPGQRATILKRMATQLDDHGVLILGEHESLTGLGDIPLKPLIPGIALFGHSTGKYPFESKQSAA